MRIGFVDDSGSLFSVAWTVLMEGHEVKYHTVERGKSQKIGQGLVDRVSLSQLLQWRPDVIVTYNSPKEAAQIVEAKISTWGSSRLTVPLEQDRMFAGSLIKQYDIGVLPMMKRFTDAKGALKFLDGGGYRQQWVFKAEGKPDVSTTHVCESEEQLRGVIEYEESQGAKTFVLQEFVDGVEISIEGWYDYRVGWLGPCNSTLERKRLFSGDHGPMTGCMGSIVWAWPGEKPKLFRQTLEKLTPYLKSISYVGPIDGNFIIDYKTRKPNFLEFTPRLGWDAFEAVMGPTYGWGNFFLHLAKGQATEFPIYPGHYLCAVRLYAPAAEDVPIWAPLRENRRLFPKDIWEDNGQLRMVGDETTADLAALFEATAHDRTLKSATAQIYDELIPQVIVPDLAYRDDIGEKAARDIELLESWGYLINL